jgi:hypothetical protein
MPYIAPFLRLVASGTLFGIEDFSFGLSFRDNNPTTQPPPDEVPQEIIDAYTDLWASNIISSSARLKTLKLNLIGTNGRYVGNDTVLYDFPGNGIVSTTNTDTPAQIAYCVTLRTDAARGRAHAGRFYLPVPAAGANTAGVIDASTLSTFSFNIDTFLKALNESMVDWQLAVMSDIGTGTVRTVTHAAYGRVLDTIRSRREKLPEAYIEGEPLS